MRHVDKKKGYLREKKFKNYIITLYPSISVLIWPYKNH